ncbi:hypothetical protein Tco_1514960, partial [Tanacetum coccineum]
MSTDKESSAAGTDNRPPMLVESDYDSWKIRIHRYIRGKPLGKLIWNSIQNGPSPHPMVTDAPTEGQTGVNMPRMKLDSEFTPEETNRDTQMLKLKHSSPMWNLDDNTTPYNQLEFERRAKVVPTEVSTGSSANISMVTILDEMRDTLDEKTQENQDLSLENQNLTAELEK